jgi:GDP-L-fucose synthase
MKSSDKIYIAGHSGLVGSAIMRRLHALGYTNIVAPAHHELDLIDRQRVQDFFQAEQPDHVFLCAARVGGILANSDYPAEFIYENLAIQTNVIHEAWRAQVKRLIFLGSSCIYPRECPQPIKEDYLLSGPLEPTNRPYALAKIAGTEMCWAYNRQYGTRFLAVMPTNLYGPGDNYDLASSHVLPALMRKMDEGKRRSSTSVTIWGTGAPRREFMYSDDMADAVVHLAGLPEQTYASLCDSPTTPPLVNIGCGTDLTIRDLAEMIQAIVGFKGKLVWDAAKPDGTPQKLLDVSRLSNLGWHSKIDLKDGIIQAYQYYLSTRIGGLDQGSRA